MKGSAEIKSSDKLTPRRGRQGFLEAPAPLARNFFLVKYFRCVIRSSTLVFSGPNIKLCKRWIGLPLWSDLRRLPGLSVKHTMLALGNSCHVQDFQHAQAHPGPPSLRREHAYKFWKRL